MATIRPWCSADVPPSGVLLDSDDDALVLLVFLDFDERAVSVRILRGPDDRLEIDSTILKLCGRAGWD